MATDYTTAERVTRLVGQLGIDLRTDDGDAAADLADAVAQGTDEVDFYLSRYSQADIALSDWATQHATYFAVRALCLRRLNDVPAGLAEECKRREAQLMLVLQGKVPAPRIAKSRRPIAVDSFHTDLNRYGNQVRVVRSKSTGVAKDFRRPFDPGAPDDR